MTSMSMSFISNEVPVFFTIKKNTEPTPNFQDYASKLIAEYPLDVMSLKKSFSNCSRITDTICSKILSKVNLDRATLSKTDYIINELIENVYKHGKISNSSKLKVYGVSNHGRTTLVVKTTNYSNREHIRGMIESFRLIKREQTEGAAFRYSKEFFQKRGHMGWITITKLNTMVHISVQKINREEYIVDTSILISTNEHP